MNEPQPPTAMCPVDASFDIDVNGFGECHCPHCGAEWLIEKSRREIAQYLAPSYLGEEVIAKEAYSIWKQEGCPDGESEHERVQMKVKDVHWWLARMKLETLLEMDAGIFKTILELEKI